MAVITAPAILPRDASPAVAGWLFTVAGLVAAMILIGGITRLTDSGLSMVEWRPWSGILPPLTQGEWERVFALYRESPEFRHLNFWMSLDDFKRIFWWEFIHRVWGRLIGLAYGLPLIWFWWRGAIPTGLKPRVLVLLALGGAQGMIGWWMVKSGLVNDPAVSQYRLATHLMMAMLILGLLIWTALDARRPARAATGAAATGDRGARRGALICLTLLVTTIAAGAFVAGLDAGLAYNTFPLMDGQWVPPGYLDQDPWWRNHLENTASVQFNHRVLATVTAAAIIANWLYLRGRPVAASARGWAALAAALAGGQFALGVAVILLAVPVALGALHQLVAVALFAAMVTLVHGLVRPARG